MARRATRFFVFTSPRSGSAWLIDMLDSHPRIAAYAELFLPGDRTTPDYGSTDVPRFEVTLDAEASRREIVLMRRRIAYLNRLFTARPEIDAIGFKLMYGHPRVHPGLLPYLGASRARAIHLVRANSLDQVLSWETAVARSSFRAHVGGDEVQHVTVRLDTQTLVERLEKMERKVERARLTLRRYGLPVLEVGYERLREDAEHELGEILPFLGVERSGWQPAPTLARMNVMPRGDLIQNLDEVERALARTRYEWMLETPGRPQPSSSAGETTTP